MKTLFLSSLLVSGLLIGARAEEHTNQLTDQGESCRLAIAL